MARKLKTTPDPAQPEWQRKALLATAGTQFGAIIRCALGIERDATPRFVGKASVTSDGFVMCDFVDWRGDGHMSAFVGSFGDLTGNVSGLSDHLNMTAEERQAFRDLIKAWVGTDWRVRNV